MGNTVTLRDATWDDMPVLEHWDTQPHVIESGGQNDGGWDWIEELRQPQPAWRQMLIAELGGRPLGFVQIIDPELEETHYWGNAEPNQRAIDIWIGEARDLGRGYGSIMMQLALARCFAPPEVTAVLIDPLLSNVPSNVSLLLRTHSSRDCFMRLLKGTSRP